MSPGTYAGLPIGMSTHAIVSTTRVQNGQQEEVQEASSADDEVNMCRASCVSLQKRDSLASQLWMGSAGRRCRLDCKC